MKFTACTVWEIMSVQEKYGILQKSWKTDGTKAWDKRTEYKVMRVGEKEFLLHDRNELSIDNWVTMRH